MLNKVPITCRPKFSSNRTTKQVSKEDLVNSDFAEGMLHQSSALAGVILTSFYREKCLKQVLLPFPASKYPSGVHSLAGTWPQLIITAPQPICSLKRRCPWWPISPKSSSAETEWGLLWIFSIDECTAKIGQRPVTRRYGLAYDTASMRATPQSREKCWRGWPSACAWRLLVSTLRSSFTDDNKMTNV